MDLYEGGIRVPFIVRWPGKISPGVTADHVSAAWDMLPTFAALAGADVRENTDEYFTSTDLARSRPKAAKTCLSLLGI